MHERKTIGYFDSGTYTPEELIIAANFVPIRLFGSLTESLTYVDAYVQSHFCSFARSCLNLALQGSYATHVGLVVTHGCDCTNQFYDLWKKHVNPKYLYYLHVPLHTKRETAKQFFVKELAHFKHSLEALVGKEVTNEDLRRAIELCNETRQWLQKISDLRKQDPPLVTGSEMHELVYQSQTTAKEDVNKVLRQKFNRIAKREAKEERKPRVLISGSVIADSRLIRLIEEAGANVVSDDLCVGTRYYETLTKLTQDPLQNIANRYLSKPILPAKLPLEERLEYLQTLISKNDIEGVILHQLKFCDPYNISNPLILEALKEANIPVLILETSYPMVGMGQLQTRVEAFIEILQA